MKTRRPEKKSAKSFVPKAYILSEMTPEMAPGNSAAAAVAARRAAIWSLPSPQRTNSSSPNTDWIPSTTARQQQPAPRHYARHDRRPGYRRGGAVAAHRTRGRRGGGRRGGTGGRGRCPSRRAKGRARPRAPRASRRSKGGGARRRGPRRRGAGRRAG